MIRVEIEVRVGEESWDADDMKRGTLVFVVANPRAIDMRPEMRGLKNDLIDEAEADMRGDYDKDGEAAENATEEDDADNPADIDSELAILRRMVAGDTLLYCVLTEKCWFPNRAADGKSGFHPAQDFRYLVANGWIECTGVPIGTTSELVRYTISDAGRAELARQEED